MTEKPATTPDESPSRAEKFIESLPDPAGRTSRDDTYARAGMITMIIGLAVAVLATILSQASDNPLDQSTQISLGITGLAAVVFGGVVFLRYSLARVLATTTRR